ncbi:MAG: hypothetical protein KHZ62_01490 [Clostridiales bacterium]|nr:hypothetical protein [Clostridiales bacterium]
MIPKLFFYELSKTWKSYFIFYGLLVVSVYLLDTSIYWGFIEGAAIGIFLFVFFSSLLVFAVIFLPLIRFYRNFIDRETTFLLIPQIKRTTFFITYFFTSIFWYILSIIIYFTLFVIANAAMIHGFVMSQIYQILSVEKLPFLMILFGLVILDGAKFLAQAVFVFSFSDFFCHGNLFFAIALWLILLLVVDQNILLLNIFDYSLILSFYSFETIINENFWSYVLPNGIVLFVYFFLSMVMIKKNIKPVIK